MPDQNTIIETTPDAVISDAPPQDMLVEVRHYYSLLEIEYKRRAAEIEAFLGFSEGSEALGTRLHKIETFLGIK
jgi:hypothetical protein